jgi:hypothetical protein
VEERPPLDQLGDLLGHLLLPDLVARGDALEHVPGEDRQVLGVVVVQVDEAAAVGEIVVERLKLRAHRQ